MFDSIWTESIFNVKSENQFNPVKKNILLFFIFFVIDFWIGLLWCALD